MSSRKIFIFALKEHLPKKQTNNKQNQDVVTGRYESARNFKNMFTIPTRAYLLYGVTG